MRSEPRGGNLSLTIKYFTIRLCAPGVYLSVYVTRERTTTRLRVL